MCISLKKDIWICIHISKYVGIFLGAMCEAVLRLGSGVIQCEELKTFFIHVSLLLITTLIFDRECQLPSRVLSHYNPQPYTLFRLVMHVKWINQAQQIHRFKQDEVFPIDSVCGLHLHFQFVKTGTKWGKLYVYGSTYCTLNTVLEVFRKLSDFVLWNSVRLSRLSFCVYLRRLHSFRRSVNSPGMDAELESRS